MKDVIFLIFEYLGWFFHSETEHLITERILMLKEYVKTDHLNDFWKCMLFETRLLKYEAGELYYGVIRNMENGHLCRKDCPHTNLRARFGRYESEASWLREVSQNNLD